MERKSNPFVRHRFFAFRHLGLSAKLLLLTAIFVMVAEVLIFLPSVSNFRVNWLKERLAAAQITTLVADAAPDHRIAKKTLDELLKNAQVQAVALRRLDARLLILHDDFPHKIAAHYDLRNASSASLMKDALELLFSREERIIRVVSKPNFGAGHFLEILVSETPLRQAMVTFAVRIFILSLLISFIAAALVYFSLNTLFVRPMMSLTHNMVRFSDNPEDASRIIVPTRREDEIGTAERELQAMQSQLVDTLQQKNRLAALGLAVSKINHDLRNMLANAQLISDRFGSSKDPTVQRFAPKLIASLDHAIRLCSETLKYGRTQEPIPERMVFPLSLLLDEVGEELGLVKDENIHWVVDIERDLKIDADRDQLHRVLSNLCRNAYQALKTAYGENKSRQQEIKVAAKRTQERVVITVSDNGPGLDKRAQENLFKAFQSSARKGGTGLGLVIAEELLRAHGGTIKHLQSAIGTTFHLTIPDRDDGKEIQ